MITPSDRMVRVLWGVVGAAVAFSLGAYGKAVASGERAGFVMNFPASGAEAGGPSMRDLTGMIIVETDGAGLPKRMLQPGVLELTSHVVRNVSDEPLRIGFDLEGLPAEFEAELGSRDKAWNPDTHEIERDIGPGEAVDLDVLLRLPARIPLDSLPLQGNVVIRDTLNRRVLSSLPVKLVRVGGAAGDCCEQ